MHESLLLFEDIVINVEVMSNHPVELSSCCVVDSIISIYNMTAAVQSVKRCVRRVYTMPFHLTFLLNQIVEIHSNSVL